MANIIITNFSDIASAGSFFDSVGGSPTVSTGNYSSIFGFSNGNGRTINYGSGSISLAKNIPAQGTYHYHGRHSRSNANNSDDLVRFNESGGTHIGIQWNANGTLSVRRSTTTVATSAASYAGPFHLYVGVIVDDAGGSVTVKVDGADAVSFSGDTRNGGSGVINQLVFPSGNASYNVTDVYLNDATGSYNNGYDGAVRVVTSRPNANGSSGVQFTPSAGSNYQNVDDAIGLHDGDSTYNESTTDGHKDWLSYPSGDFSGMTADSIKCAAAVYWARATDGGTHTMRGNVKNGGTTTNGTTRNLGATFARAQDPFPLDPATGAAWASFSAITGAELGYERVS